MKFFFIALISFPLQLFAQSQSEGFIIKIKDSSFQVVSPEKNRKTFSILIENQSSSDQIGKFMVGNKNFNYISIPSKKSGTVEIENESSLPIVFVPLSPSLQEVPLQFGKKEYEIPSTQ